MFVCINIWFYSMTSTFNYDSSTNTIDCAWKEQVIEMFKKAFTYQQVSDELKERYIGEREFSVPSIKLFCSKKCISSPIKAINIKTKRNIPILKTAIRSKHARD